MAKRAYKVEWNAGANRYAFRTPQGGYGFLSESKVREIIDSDIDVAGARMGKIGSVLKKAAQDRKDGKTTDAQYKAAVREYRDNMAAQVKGAHLGQAAAAVGGIGKMGPSDHGRCGGLLRVQYRYLENTAAEFAADPDLVLGLVPGKQGVDLRSPAYAEASRYTFERCSDINSGENGMPWVTNELEGGAHHCVAKGKQPAYSSCPGQTDLGPVKFDDPRRICAGGRICQTKCRCNSRRFKTKKAALAAIAV